jgi:hypothetical protein
LKPLVALATIIIIVLNIVKNLIFISGFFKGEKVYLFPLGRKQEESI